MLFRLLFCTVLFTAFLAPDTDAQPVRFYGQDSRFSTSTSTPTVYPDGAPLSARTRFLSNLDPATIQNESFENISASTSRPGANAAFSQALAFTGATAGVPVTATATSQGAAIYQQGTARTDGVYATDGVNFIFGRKDVVFDFGSTPVNAFGFYLNDVETVPGVVVVLTPVGGGAVDSLFYGPIPNTGATSGSPGNGQLNFIGFVDKNTNYSKVTVGFPGVGNEGFGFDELVVGELPQVITTQVTASATDITDEPGWRLLSAPVEGVTVGALSFQNLVQGVPAGDGDLQQQYPDALSNLYTGYNGGGRYDYVDAASTGTVLVPGRGFWWYWYDRDINPNDNLEGGGTSESVVLDDFALSALGTEITTDVTESFTDNTNTASNSGTGTPNVVPSYAPPGTTMPADDDFYMIGNPYAVPVLVSGISATGGTLGDTFFAWNPGNPDGLDPDDPDSGLDGPGSYELLFATPLADQQAAAAVWQGLMAEVTDPTPVGGQVTFTIDRDAVTGAGDPPFHGKTGDAYVHFTLRGTTASGYQTRDEAAYVRFRADASMDWDRFDASKPIPPVPSYAIIAPIGVRDGEAKRQAVLSLPEGGATEVALAITANESGTHTLSWEGSALDALLTDAVTGESVSMLAQTSYTFDIVPTNWTERFTVAFASTVDASAAPIAGTFVGVPTPNPSAGAVRLDVRLEAAADATVSVYDVLGRRVSTATASLAAGVPQAVSIPTAGLAPGAYVVLVESAGVRETRRITVIR